MSNVKKKFSELTRVFIGAGWSKSHEGKTKDGKTFIKDYISVAFNGGDERDTVEIILRDKATGAEVPLYGATIQVEDAAPSTRKSEKSPNKTVVAYLDLE